MLARGRIKIPERESRAEISKWSRLTNGVNCYYFHFIIRLCGTYGDTWIKRTQEGRASKVAVELSPSRVNTKNWYSWLKSQILRSYQLRKYFFTISYFSIITTLQIPVVELHIFHLTTPQKNVRCSGGTMGWVSSVHHLNENWQLQWKRNIPQQWRVDPESDDFNYRF